MLRVKPGDYLLCYLTGVSRFIGVAEITSAAFLDRQPIWKGEVFPARVRVKPIVTLTPYTAVPIVDLRGHLSFFKAGEEGTAWIGHVRRSPTRWTNEDGRAVLEAILAAKSNSKAR